MFHIINNTLSKSTYGTETVSRLIICYSIINNELSFRLQLLLFRNELKQSFPHFPQIHHQFVHLMATFNMKEYGLYEQ